MNIISHNYILCLKNLMKELINNKFDTLFDSLNPNNSVFNYIDILSNLDESLCNLAKEGLILLFKLLDENYKNSTDRKSKYYIKSHMSRSIMTIFGEITFKRTFYESKIDGSSYCFLDRYLGLHKYDYFDPYIKSLIIHYASDNSFSKTASFINDLIGNRINTSEKFSFLNRQTVRNIVLNEPISTPEPKERKTPETLYVIADEKWIPTQNNNKQKVMKKSIVLFENIKNKKLINKQIFAGDNSSNDILDYIYRTYDTDKIKTIYLLGDGAEWIKNLKFELKIHKDLNLIQGLDKFHFKQALNHITKEKELQNILIKYVLNNKRKDFKLVIENLINNTPSRKEMIETKSKYIINNWTKINNLYKNKLSCPMESQISHNIAALFTSRPKGYSKSMIEKLLKIRLLYKNNNNLKQLYLNNYNSKEIKVYNEEETNYSLFDKLTPKETYTLNFKSEMKDNYNLIY